MAFNLGRPALFAGEETIRHCRGFLNHPLSVQNDSRLVATCELLTARRESWAFLISTLLSADLSSLLPPYPARSPFLLPFTVQLHQPFALIPNAPYIADLDEKLRRAGEGAAAWFVYWSDYYEALGVPKGSFLRESRKF